MNKDVQKSIDTLTKSDWVWLLDNFKTNGDQLFTFTSLDTDETVHVNVTKLRKALDNDKIKNVSLRMMFLHESLYKQIVECQGIERNHLDTISLDDAAFEPAIVIEENQTHIIVDGNHKIVKAYEMGLRRRPAIFIPHEEITPYLYTMPENVSKVLQTCTRNNVQFSEKLVESFREDFIL